MERMTREEFIEGLLKFADQPKGSEAFDQNNPLDQLCEFYRKGILDLCERALKERKEIGLENADAVQAILMGCLVGMFNGAFAAVKRDGWPVVLAYAVQAIGPMAGKAESIINSIDAKSKMN